MSNLALNTGEDFPEAAACHLEDAGTLLAEGRSDNAAYLAGYVVECTVKTLLRVEQGDHPEVHNLASLSRQASELAALPGARTARYAAALSSSHPIYDYNAGGWRESLRYRPSGTISKGAAAEWLKEAGRLFDDVINSLRLDGILD